MRKEVPTKLEEGRVIKGPLASDSTYGMTGCFVVMGPTGSVLRFIASTSAEPESEGWEHVSVSTGYRIPNWIEMCFVKDLFWNEEECVIQFHPPKSEYVNHHPFTLHLWKDTLNNIRRPSSVLVGPKTR